MWATGSQNTPNQALQQTGHANNACSCHYANFHVSRLLSFVFGLDDAFPGGSLSFSYGLRRNPLMARHESRRSRKADLSPVVGIAWYDSAQWIKLKQVAADAEQLNDTHEEWQRNAERAERRLSAEGMIPRRVPIDVDALVQWCRVQNKPVTGATRAEYTSRI